MAFENVNVTSLKQSINSCLQSINYNATTDIISNISSDNVWQTESRNNLKKALETLINTRYKELKDYLNKCLTITNYIERYKEEEAKINRYHSQISYYVSRLTSVKGMCDMYTVSSGDSFWAISQKFGIDMNSIVLINGFNGLNDTLYVGQTILIPNSSSISSISSISGQISQLNSAISECRANMKNLETQVSNMI